MTTLLSMAQTARSQGHSHRRAKPPHPTHLPTHMRSLSLREEGLSDKHIFADGFGLGFLLN